MPLHQSLQVPPRKALAWICLKVRFRNHRIRHREPDEPWAMCTDFLLNADERLELLTNTVGQTDACREFFMVFAKPM